MILLLNGCRGLINHPADVVHHGPPASDLAHLITQVNQKTQSFSFILCIRIIFFSGYDHGFKEKDFEKLATITEGKSCADIHTIVKKLERKRWKSLTKATHFKKKFVNGHWLYQESDEKNGGKEMKFAQVGSYTKLAPTKVTMFDLKQSIFKHKNTVSCDDQAVIDEYETNNPSV